MTLPDPYADEPPALGIVLVDGRGSLPFTVLDGEPLVSYAALAMTAAGIDLVDLTTGWAEIRAAGRPLVLHDALCPLTPPGFLADTAALARRTGRVAVGYRPVTDTMKSVHDGRVMSGEARDELVQITSPVVLPAEVVARLDTAPGADGTATLAALLEVDRLPDGLGEIEWLEAPGSARRVVDEDDLRVLEAGGSSGW